jgi:hypothetical protein
MYIQNTAHAILSPIQNTVTISQHIIFLVIYNVISGIYRASLYNLVNKPTWCTSFFLVYLYMSISACFGLLCAHHQEIQLCLYDTCYLFFCIDGCLVCSVERYKCRINTVVSPDNGHIAARNM